MATVFVSHPRNVLENYFGDRAMAALKAIVEVQINPGNDDLSSTQLAHHSKNCDVIISHRQTVGDEALFAAAPQLLAFVRCAIDIRNIDVDAANRHGVLVTQASAGFIVSVSEWVIGVMIDLSRHISMTTEKYHSNQLVVPLMGRELRGSTLGVIGYGQIGQYLCDVALALGMNIVVHDPYKKVVRPEFENIELNSLLKLSDYVVCLATATKSTENMFDINAFKTMKRSAFFINAARGNLVNEADLLASLDAGLIAGCALDVGRASDQMPSKLLSSHPKVIATPHIGGLTPPAIEHQALETVTQVAELLKGNAPKGAINAQQAFRWQKATKGAL